MECNKEEALRAKELAEKKMQNKDFAGAQKLALKAQKLYPGLENISQMVTVCEVHVSAELNFVGTEMDWYGILQVPHSVDELSIKKQYRKLALVLHPDKNKYPGAEAAFKLIGEANMVLSDRAKRSLYDVKRETIQTSTMKQQHPHNKSSIPNKQPGLQNNPSDNMRQPHQQQTKVPLTFWTSCPFCSTKYQHYRNLLNIAIPCQNCLRPFVAYDLNAQGGSSGANSGYAWNQSAAPQHKDIPNQSARQTGQKSAAGNSSSGFRSQEKTSTESDSEFGGRSQRKASEDGDEAMPEERGVKMKKGVSTGKSSGNVARKRGRMAAAETRESISSESTDVEDAEQLEKGEMESSPIKKKNRNSSKDAENSQVNSNLASDLDTHANLDPISYPEPEFHDFDKDRVQDNFKVDQLWAVYDDTDGMPRWYARIRKIYPRGSRLRILWLEAAPKDQDGCNWLGEKLPVACGNFRSGQTQDTEDLLMLSHLASWEKGNSRGTYKIYPRKGDVWALFKDWSIQWSTCPDAHRKHEFEFVEILCDYSEGTGIEVACLVMLKGFTSLFQRIENMEKSTFQIPPNELLRFSHRVPCYRMTGEERQGVPAGSFELDPASVFCEGFSPAKGSDKSAGVESNTAGMENETPAAEPIIINTAGENTSRNERISQKSGSLEEGNCFVSGKDTKSKENLENIISGTVKDTPISGPDVLNAPKKITSSNEEKIQNKENLINRRCSPRKRFGAHEKKPSQEDASLHLVAEATSLHGESDTLDDMLDNKPGNISSVKSQINGKEKNSVAESVPINGATEEYCSADPVFYNFDSEKLEDKFQQGQIWALYSNEDDGLPKYYARIKKVESPKFKVHATWLYPYPESEKEIWWSKKELAVTCGKFVLKTRGSFTSEEVSLFSHQVSHTCLKGKYLIFPRKGDVWATYKNWSSEWTFEDLKHCEYELVEVLNNSHLAFEVMVLEAVDNYRTVYRGGTKINIPQDESLRFSHLVPSFRLTKEGGGKLKGCLELDTLALPASFLNKNSK